MQFPIILIKSTDPSIYYFEKNNFGLVSRGGEAFYKSGEVYDSRGDKYVIEKIKRIRKAPLGRSIKYFQQMWLVDMETIFEETISIVDFKKLINDHIERHSKYWIKRDIIKDLQLSISQKDSHSEIIRYLK